MDDLLARVVEGEIRLGLAFVEAASTSLELRNPGRFDEARSRAHLTYLRARARIRELPEESKQAFSARLLALRQAIDKLPESRSTSRARPDAGAETDHSPP